jgi:hypothetical protein
LPSAFYRARQRRFGKHDVTREQSDGAAKTGACRKVKVPREELLLSVGDTTKFARRDRREVIAVLGEDVVPSCHHPQVRVRHPK